MVLHLRLHLQLHTLQISIMNFFNLLVMHERTGEKGRSKGKGEKKRNGRGFGPVMLGEKEGGPRVDLIPRMSSQIDYSSFGFCMIDTSRHLGMSLIMSSRALIDI